MKAYVINLDSRMDRMESFKMNQFPFPVMRMSGIKTDPGDTGCARSHLAILHKHWKSKEFPFVVFEDDCMLMQPWEWIEKIMGQLPKDWDALWLGGNLRESLVKYSENLYRLHSGFCLHAVIYNSWKMLDFILRNYRPPLRKDQKGGSIDSYYANKVQKQFKCFITYPLAAIQRVGWSDISEMEVDYASEILENYDKFIVKI